ncbi:hypothetical protein L593_10945 [Salinarchaeum sp. Harcht-Bsk1]|uniref:type IV pilin n=1 Tax=Salinarchaeum sp. Harcht-Bsk1 TaxID=1333523 RepID=UPI0003424453|nr:type IV pilin N-terminal domain-containing protein [Salinarchaeum sp. Harcht-Bsk1]AGN02134.1 hypothetical protein L593_10945 [Salinarchaeum sp. Harcht-Bsk1]
MRLRELFTDDDAVSPVIGVILMVAITVILAAVIGAFVLGFGGGGPSAPSVQWEATDTGTPNGEVTFSHGGGDTISEPGDVLGMNFDGSGSLNTTDPSYGGGSPMDVGDSWTVGYSSTSSGDQIILTWSSPDGDSTQELKTHTLN